MLVAVLALSWIALVFPSLAASQHTSAGQTQPNAHISDCSESTNPPANSTRVYIALRNGVDGSGRSMADARDGSTAAAFDTILRCYSEGCPSAQNTGAQNSGKPIAKTENLTVCLGPGTFLTLGNYDYIIAVPHKNPAGFTLGKGWKIHGAGKDKTTIKLSAYLPITDLKDPRHMPVDTGVNIVFGTNSDSASGVEISDLTIDGNYPEMKARSRANGVKALGLEAIHLRSDLGANWIHDVNIIRLSTEIGAINERWEAFPVWIIAWDRSKPGQNRGNLIENVSMSQAFGTVCTAIAVGNATAEVRNNLVDGYQIGYGGWDLGATVFHDNTAINTEYGFNIDSLVNNGVRIEGNKIIHPRKYGFVVGGGGTYSNFKFLNNTVQIDRSGVSGFVFQGNVTGALVAGNKILADNSSGAHATAIQNKSGTNASNTYQSNQIASGMTVVLDEPAQRRQGCFFNNRDERGNPRKDLPDSGNGPCVSENGR